MIQTRIPNLVHRKLTDARFALLAAGKDLAQVTQTLLSRHRHRLELLRQRVADASPDKLLSRGSVSYTHLFGVGSLGGALLQDSGLKHFGLEIVAAFDVDPTLVGTNLNGIPIYHSDDFLKKMEEYDVQIGVLTVPIEIAQCITDMMVDGGIKAVWNFTPFRILSLIHI